MITLFRTAIGDDTDPNSQFGKVSAALSSITTSIARLLANSPVPPVPVPPGVIVGSQQNPDLMRIDLVNSNFANNMYNILRTFGNEYGFSPSQVNMPNYLVPVLPPVDPNFVAQCAIELVTNGSFTMSNSYEVCDVPCASFKISIEDVETNFTDSMIVTQHSVKNVDLWYKPINVHIIREASQRHYQSFMHFEIKGLKNISKLWEGSSLSILDCDYRDESSLSVRHYLYIVHDAKRVYADIQAIHTAKRLASSSEEVKLRVPSEALLEEIPSSSTGLVKSPAQDDLVSLSAALETVVIDEVSPPPQESDLEKSHEEALLVRTVSSLELPVIDEVSPPPVESELPTEEARLVQVEDQVVRVIVSTDVVEEVFDLDDFDLDSFLAQGDNVVSESVINDPGVVTMLSRDVESVTPTFGSSFSKSSDAPWDFADLARRPVYIIRKRLDFNDTHSILNKPVWMPQEWLNEYAVGGGFIANNTHIGRMVEHFAFHKFDLVFRLHTNTNHFYGGDLGVVFDYGGRHGRLSHHNIVVNLSKCEASGMHHALMDLSMQNEIELRVPFVSICESLTTNGDFYGISHMGTVQLFQTLRLFAPSPSVPDTIHVMLSCYAEQPFVDVLHSYTTIFNRFVPQGFQNSLKNVSAGVYSFAGLDVSSTRLALSDIVNSGVISGDVTSLLEIARKPTICSEGRWLGTSTEGDVLLSYMVHPMNFNRNVASVIEHDAPLVACVSEMFSYWQGSLVFHFKFGASQFHAGRFVVCFFPCQYGPPDLTTYYDVPHVIVDVKEKHEFKFVVPFVSSTSWRPTVYKQVDTSLVQCSTGVLQAWVLDPLVSPSGSTSNIDFNVWVSAGPDFNLAVPRELDYESSRIVSQALGDNLEQSAVLGKSMVRSINTFKEDFTCLMTLARRFSMCVNMFDMEDPKYKRAAPTPGATRYPTSLCFPVTPTLQLGNGASILSYLSQFFTMWRGSLKFKVHVQAGSRNNSAFVRVSHDPTLFSKLEYSVVGFDHSYDGDEDRRGLGLTVIQLMKENIAEVEVPYYSMYNSLYLRSSYMPMSRVDGYPVGCTTNGSLCLDWRAHQNVELSVYIAAGDDFEFLCPNGFTGLNRTRRIVDNVLANELPFVAQGSVEILSQGLMDRMVGVDTVRLNDVVKKVDDIMPMVAGSAVNISALSGKLLEMLPAVESVLKGGLVASDFLSKIQNFCVNIGTFVNEGVDSVKSMLSRLAASAPLCGIEPMILVLVLGFAVYIARKDVSNLTLFASVAVALIPLAVTDLGRNFALYVCQNIEKLIKINDSDVVAQGDVFDFNITPKLVVHLLLAGIALVVYKCVPGYDDIMKLTKECGGLGHQFNGIKNGVKVAEELGESASQVLMSVLSKMYGPNDMAVNSLNLMLRFDVLKWLHDVNDMALLENRFTAFSSPERITHIRLLYDRVDCLRDAMAKGEFHVGLATQVTSAIKEVTKLRNEIYQYKGLDVARVDPFHVCFMGKPGVGKSALMSKFVTNMLQFRGEPLTDAVYARSPANKYWDGYRNELVTTFDDLAAVADNVTPTDITEMINLKSNAPTQVVMAALDDKGKHFTSKYIVSTTNIKMLPADCMLRCADAFHRRRDVLIDVIRVKDIGTTIEDEESASHLAFVLYDPVSGGVLSEQMSYAQMFELVMRKCEVYMQSQDRLLSSYKRDTYGTKLRDQIGRNAEESLFNFPVNNDLALVDSVPGIRTVVAQGAAEDTIVSKAICESMYFTPSGEMLFSCDVARAAFNDLDNGCKELIVSKVKTAIAVMIETLDIQSVLNGIDDNMSKLLMKQCLKGVSIDLEGKLVFQDEDYEEAFNSWNSREQSVFYSLVKMESVIESQKKKIEISRSRIEKVKLYIEKCWSSLSDDQKSLFRLAMGAGVFVAVIGTIYGISRVVKRKSVSNIVDNSILRSKSVSLDNVVVPSQVTSDDVECEISETSVDDCFIAEEDSPNINDRVALRKKKFINRSKFAWMKNIVREGLEVVPEEVEVESSTLEVGQTKKKAGVAGRQVLTWTKNSGSNEVEQELSLRPNGKSYFDKQVGFNSFNTKGESFKARVRDEVRAVLEFNETPVVTSLGKVESQGVALDVVEIADVKAQSARDNEAQDLIVRTLVHNLGLIYYVKADKVYKMQCTFLTDSIVCAPYHFFNRIDNNSLFYVQIGPIKYEIRFSKKQLYRLGDSDCCLYRCGSRVPKVKSILSRIARRSDHEDFYATSGTLVNCSYEDGFLQMRLHCVARVGAHVEKVLYDIGEEQRQELVGYGYMANTQNGECGSPLVVDRPGSVRKIFGMHAAANTVTKKGYCVKLVAEDIEEAISVLCPVDDPAIEGLNLQDELDKGTFDPEVSSKGIRDLPEGNIGFVGVVPKSMATRVPKKTAIRPSRLNGLIAQVRTEPSILDAKDSRLGGKEFDPLVSGIAKYGESCVPFSRDDLDKVELFLKNKLRNIKCSRDVKTKLTLDQVINGVPGLDYYDPMNMKSSEGYPFIKDRVGMSRGKKHLFKEVGEMSNGAPKYDIDSPKLRAAYEFRIKEAEAGRRVFSVSQECTKDERLKLKKIYENPKTRTFSIMPCDYTMATRAYFLDFCVAIMNHRDVLPIKVGINPMSLEWTELFMDLKSVSAVGFAADYKTFDGQACAEIFNMMCRVINYWYGDSPKSQKVRQVLMNEISKRVTICEDTLLTIENGLPSGVSITVILNSFLNWVYLLLSWLNLAPSEDLRSLTEFDRLVRMALYGDDNNVSVHESVVSWFNLRTVGEFLFSHKIIITDDEKREWQECQAWWSVSDFTFLKRAYKPHNVLPFFMLAPLDEVSIWERIMWYREGGDEIELLYTNIENSLEDAFHHGRLFYNMVKSKVDDVLMLLDMPASIHSYDEAELRWFEALELPFNPDFLSIFSN